jgi:ATP-binding cassette subfamily B protein
MDPKILILDDATSSVDVATESRIQDALAQLRVGRTSFVIAQRISTVKNADLVLVLKEGTIVAEGRHDELLESSPEYADLFYSQLENDLPSDRPVT